MSNCEYWKNKFHEGIAESVIDRITWNLEEYYNEADNEFSELCENRLKELKVYELLDEIKGEYDLENLLSFGIMYFFNDALICSVFSDAEKTAISIETTIGKLLFAGALSFAEQTVFASNFEIDADALGTSLLMDDIKEWAKILASANVLDEPIIFKKTAGI